MSAEDCALIMLASGLSERFGTADKLLAKLAGRAVIDHTIENIAPIGFGSKIAVIGARQNHNAPLRGKLKQAEYKIIENPAPETGQGRSLALGVRTASGAGFKRACIVLADMPFVPAAHFTALLKLSQTSDQVVTQTDIDGQSVTLPPCVFSGQALLRLSTASGDRGARAYLQRKDMLCQPLSSWRARDIDTLEDLQSAEHDLSLLKSDG